MCEWSYVELIFFPFGQPILVTRWWCAYKEIIAYIVSFLQESFLVITRPFRPCLIQLSSENTALLWRLKRRNKDGGHTIWLSPILLWTYWPLPKYSIIVYKVLKVRVTCKCSWSNSFYIWWIIPRSHTHPTCLYTFSWIYWLVDTKWWSFSYLQKAGWDALKCYLYVFHKKTQSFQLNC